MYVERRLQKTEIRKVRKDRREKVLKTDFETIRWFTY